MEDATNERVMAAGIAIFIYIGVVSNSESGSRVDPRGKRSRDAKDIEDGVSGGVSSE